MLKLAASAAIVGYQRYLSPYKGFRCAYRAKTGRASCSEYAKRLVNKLGVGALSKGLPKQFARCRLAFATLSAYPSSAQYADNRKRKRSDACDCSPCDLPLNLASDAVHCDGAIGMGVLPCDCSPF
jgi:putative component of membrane protein insertase Oxa1/YidC/SpoIIIJ protein YidD